MSVESKSTETLTQLHQSWCGLTGQELNYRATERLFFEFADLGFNIDDLRCVIEGMKRHNHRNDSKYKFHVHKVVGDLEVFASLLADFRSLERARPKAKTPQVRILEAFLNSPAPAEDKSAQVVREVLRKIGGQA